MLLLARDVSGETPGILSSGATTDVYARYVYSTVTQGTLRQVLERYGDFRGHGREHLRARERMLLAVRGLVESAGMQSAPSGL